MRDFSHPYDRVCVDPGNSAGIACGIILDRRPILVAYGTMLSRCGVSVPPHVRRSQIADGLLSLPGVAESLRQGAEFICEIPSGIRPGIQHGVILAAAETAAVIIHRAYGLTGSIRTFSRQKWARGKSDVEVLRLAAAEIERCKARVIAGSKLGQDAADAIGLWRFVAGLDLAQGR